MKRIILYAAAAIAFAACSSDEETASLNYVADEGEIQLMMVHPGQTTRATETAFETKDSIGVYVTAADAALQVGGNEVNNELFTYNGTSWTSKRKVYWNEGKHNVYAYYPYERTPNDTEDYSFSVHEDQSSAWGYTRSDFLWASAMDVTASATPVPMQFRHCMTNVVVKLEKGESFEGDIPADAQVYLYSTVTKASIDLSSGDVTKDNYAGSTTIRCRQLAADRYTAIVVPQSITSRRPLVEVITKGVSYLMEGKISYKPGYRHTLVVTLDQNPEKIKIIIGGEIQGW